MSQPNPMLNQGAFIQFYDRFILSNGKLIAVLLLLFAGLMAYHAQNYKVDASADSLVLEGDQDLEFFREIGKRFASEEYLIIAYQPETPLLEDQTLNELSDLVSDLQAVEGVASVTSILDVPLLYSPRVSITDLGASIRTLRDQSIDKSLVYKEFETSPIYRQLLTSKDTKTTAIQVNIERSPRYTELLEKRDSLREREANGEAVDSLVLATAESEFKAYATEFSENQQRLVAMVRDVIDQHRGQANEIFLGGVPMIANDMVKFVKSDLQTFGIGILIFVVVLLTVIFRAIRWVLLPLFACVLTNIVMLGMLGWLDWRMTVISSNFVALLLIIVLAIAVHLIVRFRELESLYPDSERREVILATVNSMLRPCIYTGLTTVVAFMSLVISGIRPVIDFGWMMTIGVVVALLLTFLVVPIGMMFGSSSSPDKSDSNNAVFTLRFARITEHHGGLVLAVAAAVLLFTVTGLKQLKVENRFIDYFDEQTEIYRGMELVDSELGGTIPLEIILFPKSSIDTTKKETLFEDEFDDFDSDFAEDAPSLTIDDDDEFEDDFFEEESGSQSSEQLSRWFTLAGLNEIEKIHNHVDGLDETGKVLSLATVFKIAKDLLGSGLDDIQLTLAYQKLPPSIQEVMVSPYLNANSDEARITVRVKETSRTLNRAELLASLNDFMTNEMGYSKDEYRFTGMLVLYNNMLQSLFSSQILTLGMVFAAITLMLIILFQSLSLALIGIVPNLMAALLVLGGMGWAGIPLDMMTITIAAISIGIGVDNTIHYVHRFKREFAVDQNYVQAMYRCHGSIGRAMYYTSITIIFGFSILMLSNFKPSIYFGLLTGVAMFSALLGSLMLLPKLLLMIKPLGKESLSA